MPAASRLPGPAISGQMKMKSPQSTASEIKRQSVAGRQIRTTAVIIIFACLAFLLWQLRHVLVIAFAAIVIATLLVGAGALLQRFTPLTHRWAVAVAGLIIAAALALTVWLAWPQLSTQSSNLFQQLNASLTMLQDQTGMAMPDSLSELMNSSGGLLNSIWQNVTALAGTIVSAVTGLILVILAGAFLAADPRLYRDGLVLLVPPHFHEQAKSALSRSGRGLTLWLMGKLISMSIIGVLVGIGAWAIGLPSPLALGLVAGLLEFLPLIGPFLGAIPGLLLAFSQDGTTFLWAPLLYTAIQQLESNLITPAVLQEAVSVPPALFMLSVLCMGTLFGVMGVILSGPLTVAVFVLVRAIYVEDILGEELEKTRGV